MAGNARAVAWAAIGAVLLPLAAATAFAQADRFFAILSEGVHRFEGTINQFTGDGIMALFGAPIAPVESGDRARSADGSEIAGYVDIGR
jgi:class 3 adenylate cyclase